MNKAKSEDLFDFLEGGKEKEETVEGEGWGGEEIEIDDEPDLVVEEVVESPNPEEASSQEKPV
jgi:hypothetical protein